MIASDNKKSKLRILIRLKIVQFEIREIKLKEIELGKMELGKLIQKRIAIINSSYVPRLL